MSGTNDIEFIADTYGYDAQAKMLIEECAELIQAVNKFDRCPGMEQKLNLVEEMVDVQIMLWQIQYLMNCYDETLEFIDAKVKRQVERIGKEK